MLARITDRKIPYVYIHVYQIIKNWGPGLYNFLHPNDNTKMFFQISLMRNWTEVHALLGEGRGKNLGIFLLRKGTFTMINEYRYGQTWKIWPSPLSLPLYSAFKYKLNFLEVYFKGYFAIMGPFKASNSWYVVHHHLRATKIKVNNNHI